MSVNRRNLCVEADKSTHCFARSLRPRIHPCPSVFIRGFNSLLMKLSEMRELLARRGIQLTKSLGQNFLHDGNQLRRIVEAAELGPADKVLEIGPGLGPLTELLLEKAGAVLAIEKDARLVAVLRERFGLEFRLQPVGRTPAMPPKGGTPNLQLLHDDALEFLSGTGFQPVSIPGKARDRRDACPT